MGLAGAFCGLPGSALATTSCGYDNATDTVTVTLAATSDEADIRRSGNAIQVNTVNCGSATVNNTDQIEVDGSADPAQKVVIDLSGGPLGPGTTAESSGTSEIEFNVNFGAGYGEEIAVQGASTADNVVFGTAGALLNSDSDVDLTWSGLDQVRLLGGDGGDTLSIGGGGGSGSPLNRLANIDGGPGADDLTGSRQGDTIVGGTENDTIHGGPGNDALHGNDGADKVYGEEGTDYVDGDLGDDTLDGGADTDYLGYYGGAALDGADDVTGGRGYDYLYLSNRISNMIVRLDNKPNDGADIGADGTADEGDNYRSDIEYVTTGSGNDVIDGSYPISKLYAHGFDANGGNDELDGGDEADSLYGREGNDTFNAGDGNDYLYGAGGNDVMNGEAGADNIYQDDGDDTVDGGPGDDYMDGGAASGGADDFAGGDGSDQLYLGSRTANMTIDEDNKPDDGTDVDGVGGAEEGDNVRDDIEYVTLGQGNDYFSADTTQARKVAADNTIYGQGGNDILLSGPGEDYVDGGLGDDQFTGGPGEDTVYGQAGLDNFKMKDGFLDHVDGGSGDGVNDTGQFDSYDALANFP